MQSAENEVTGQSRLNRNFGRFEVSNLTHHDHIRIASQHAAKPRGKGQVDFRLHRDLQGTFEAVLNRVLDRDDFPVFRVQTGKETEQAGRFTTASRSRHKNNPVGTLQNLLNIPSQAGRHLEPVHVELLLPEETQTDALSFNSRDSRDAGIDRLASHLQCDTTVLRLPFFGNIQARHQFDSRDHRAL